MGNRNILILIGALVVAAIVVLFANAYLTGVEERAQVQAEEQRLARIVVATQPMEFGTPLTQENVRLQNFPASSVPVGAFTTIEAALDDGRVALRPIVPGEPILADKVSGADGRAVLSANLPEGMRAVSIPIGSVTGVSGFVRPGDTVDVILVRQIPGEGADEQDLMTDVILDRVQVLAIDQVANDKATEPSVGQTAVVQVDLFDAQKLAIAQRIGTLTLALRNVETIEPVGTTTVTARDLPNAGLFRPAPPEGRSGGASFAQAPASPGTAGPPVYTGPSMTIIRGTEAQAYPVGRLGGR